ncbi:glycosyl hydrolase [Sunxiuqinia dokdonensis]|uniref:Glycosyl hydrolase family 2, sugar binding domain protein n=1 Tax=Sunxiuqinia dokdonensis TaxID=1409788 RepID=A0A0L8VA43_9BACT|nr:glycosyl hydrolase [Sunxiuqinia dokdonensis]KOH45304.1 glycosyl hydrolase family 2, sugar binding domain protein [Sunxiuqinia dokdonensis]
MATRIGQTKASFLLNGFAICLLIALVGCSTDKSGAEVEWPEITNETKPWTRWWWHDSAVNPTDLTANMEELEEAGFGGLEITPIYGVKGYEDQALLFQSDEWMDALEHTLNEGKRLDLGIDLANASGWPFGGPWISAEDACRNVQFKQYSLKTGQRLNEKVTYIQEPLIRAVGRRVEISEVKFPISSNTNLNELALDQIRFEKPLPLQTLMAYSDAGEVLELTSLVDGNGQLEWQAPEGNWNLYAVFQGWHGKMVERAGQGGEGNVIDHFSEEATRKFLKDYDDKAEGRDLSGLRAFFNDSYEVDDASGESNWTPRFFEEFEARRGYDLKNYLPALFGNDSEEKNSRVLCDYRETISDLLLDEFTRVWAGWAESHNAVIRNQAHGSPANILDLYEASHIPETEGLNPMRIKMATSAGHVSGKELIACEASTWLDEHFLANLGDAKQNFDRYLAHGVNHIVYHGTPYSPQGEEWPGWLFYAAVHFAPTNSWWPDMKALNDYVTNCQSFMQKSIPNNDILLYFPIYDTWSQKGRSMLAHFGKPQEPLTRELSELFLAKGYSFDYISDRQIQKLTAQNKLIKAPGATYKTIVVPKCEHMPLATMEKLLELAEAGATIVFQEQLPVDVPGMGDLKNRQQAYEGLVKSMEFNPVMNLSVYSRGDGNFLMSDDMDGMLEMVDVYPEELAQLGLWYNRVKRVEGTCYFITNWSDQPVDQWVTLQTSGEHAAWFNPMNRAKGKASVQKVDENQSQVYLQLAPGETLILQWYPYKVQLDDYPMMTAASEKNELSGEWTVAFEKGGPSLPASYQTTELKSWTEQSDELKKFSGTASYQISFDKPQAEASAYLLDLGEVHESASVYLNGEKLGTLVGPSYQLSIDPSLLKETNELEVKVSNLMANRIIDMDKNGVNYKKFYNINFAANKRENVGPDGVFTAAHWEPLPSGLLGPVSLTPLEIKNQ